VISYAREMRVREWKLIIGMRVSCVFVSGYIFGVNVNRELVFIGYMYAC